MKAFFTEEKVEELTSLMMHVNENTELGLMCDTQHFSQFLSQLGQNLAKSAENEVSLLLVNGTHVMSAHIRKEEIDGQQKYRVHILEPYQLHGNHLDIIIDDPKELEQYTAKQLFGNYEQNIRENEPTELSFKVVCNKPGIEPNDVGYTDTEQSIQTALFVGRQADFTQYIKNASDPVQTLSTLIENPRTSSILGLYPHMIDTLAQAMESNGMDGSEVIKVVLNSEYTLFNMVNKLKEGVASPELQGILQAIPKLDKKSQQKIKEMLFEKIAQSPKSDILTQLALESKLQEAHK
jgi:hypothetical protein